MGNTINLTDAVLESGLTADPNAASDIAISIVRLCARINADPIELLDALAAIPKPSTFLDQIKYGETDPTKRME